MKQFCSLILSVFMLCALVLPAHASGEISVTTREELEAIALAPELDYRLDADIDLGGDEWLPIPFYGKFNGNGHTLYNLKIRTCGTDSAVTVDGNHKGYDSLFAGLFSVIQNAEIRDLNILGADVEVHAQEDCFAAILSGYIKESRIQNCSVSGRVHLLSDAVMVGVGGICGFGQGEILSCVSQVELVLQDRYDHDRRPRPEMFMGGVLGCGNCTMNDNQVQILGINSCWGYAHNGGLVGMHYWYNRERPNGQICDNHVEGRITFFENNPDRRAYCEGIGGEILSHPFKMIGNTTKFKRDERFQEKQELPIHSCEKPEILKQEILHTDDAWGYILHYCPNCGYEWKSDYHAPGHIPGDWEVTAEPGYDHPGSRCRSCKVCGEILEKESIPELIAVSSCQIDPAEITLSYKEELQLSCRVEPQDAENPQVSWESSDPTIVSVDQSGNLTALKAGSAEITCTSVDGFAASSCPVTVRYTFPQQLIRYLLFGWIWY